MTALEYMEKQVQKHRRNLEREASRDVPTDMVHAILAKVHFYEAAVAALRGQDATDTNVGHKTNADHIRSMSDEELAEFLEYLYSHCDGPWEILFERKFCDHCPAPEYELEDGRNLKLHECDFTGGKCPHGSDVLWWLKQPYKEDT